MTTVSYLMDRTLREYLYPASEQPAQAILNGALDGSSTSFTLITSTLSPDEEDIISPGVVLEIDEEQVLVTNYNPDTDTVTCRRGHSGTTAVSHDDSTLVRLMPAFSRAAVFDAVSDEIVSLSPALWAAVSDTVTSDYDPVEAPATAISIGDLIYMSSDGRPQNGSARLVRNYPPSSTGKAIMFETVPNGRTCYITYKAAFDRPTSTSDLLADLNLRDEWYEIVVVGAASRLLMQQEDMSIDFMTELEEGQIIPPGTSSSVGLRMRGLRDRMLTAASQRLTKEYPPVTTYNNPFRSQQRS